MTAIRAFFSQSQSTFFQFSKEGREDLSPPPLVTYMDRSIKIPQAIFPSSKFFLIISVRLIKACVVEYFCQGQNVRGKNKVIITKKFRNSSIY